MRDFEDAPSQDEIVEWETEMKYDYEQYLLTVDEDEAISLDSFKRNVLKALERDLDADDYQEIYAC